MVYCSDRCQAPEEYFIFLYYISYIHRQTEPSRRFCLLFLPVYPKIIFKIRLQSQQMSLTACVKTMRRRSYLSTPMVWSLPELRKLFMKCHGLVPVPVSIDCSTLLQINISSHKIAQNCYKQLLAFTKCLGLRLSFLVKANTCCSCRQLHSLVGTWK